MKITITNGYTWYNKGDSGILLGTINSIKKIYGQDIEIRILSFTPDEDAKRYCMDPIVKGVYSNILNPYPFNRSKIGKLLAIAKLFVSMVSVYIKLNLFRNTFINNNFVMRVLNESDLIVVCGGGFLGGKKFNSFIHLFQMYVNNKMYKPVILWGTSIEPMKNRLIAYFTEKEIKKLTHVFPREVITEKYLSELIDKSKFTLIPDMAFMLENKHMQFDLIKELREQSDLLIGITVRKWHFPNNANSFEAKQNYINSIIDTIRYYVKNKDARFIFIPQVIFQGDDDSVIAGEIKEGLPKEIQDCFIIRRDDWSPLEIKSLIKNLDLFIGTRMHSNIFATSMAVPTIAIAYEKKTNGIMNTVGMNDYIVEIDNITSEDLIDKVDKCYRNREKITMELSNRIPEIRNEIINKSKFIKEL